MIENLPFSLFRINLAGMYISDSILFTAWIFAKIIATLLCVKLKLGLEI